MMEGWVGIGLVLCHKICQIQETVLTGSSIKYISFLKRRIVSETLLKYDARAFTLWLLSVVFVAGVTHAWPVVIICQYGDAEVVHMLVCVEVDGWEPVTEGDGP